jgi:hypothetical protein
MRGFDTPRGHVIGVIPTWHFPASVLRVTNSIGSSKDSRNIL